MENTRKYARELQKKIKNVEKLNGDYISYVLHENFSNNQHIMLVEEKVDMSEIYGELSDLEKADLIDFWNKENNGRSNKKRRNLLCWP